ncbi:hypothetical protein SAMN04488168_11436 [Bacillus sp. 491mf]|uniref:hypothetical protein n=1 Tax=unclassified Bacillus (in: firmicutes) TaxID=185979 RepID=UPI0008E4FC5B|nr:MULTISPECIES: hypothetical protein [unclassified Bacillus (in: firmicutes)]SFC99893.1 hypothetical protein SAMN04488168_11436 [Bacillus sp. 491mf]
MNISERITEQQFKEILMYIYMKGEESNNVEVKRLIEEIKQYLISIMNTSK